MSDPSSTLVISFAKTLQQRTFAIGRENEEAEANEILRTTKECLLRGLSDPDPANQLTVQNFWSHETRLPAETVDRLVAMLEAMYRWVPLNPNVDKSKSRLIQRF